MEPRRNSGIISAKSSHPSCGFAFRNDPFTSFVNDNQSTKGIAASRYRSLQSCCSIDFGGTEVAPSDCHLESLNLGRRIYYPDIYSNMELATYPGRGKKSKPNCPGKGCGGGKRFAAAAVAPNCQVNGCGAELDNAKDYHRRHKVCEMHSKASKVLLFGLEQRFCQQCSRFHAIAEFDNAKRSCRRTLACHNDRRRKSLKDFNSRGHLQSGCTLSLLSPKYNDSREEMSDLSSRSSEALRDLIAEHRAACFAGKLSYEQREVRHSSFTCLNG